MGNSNSKNLSKAERRKRTIRIIQAVIVLLIVLSMIVSTIIYSFGN